MKHSDKGFTIIELLIVMSLLGILVAVLLPRYQDLTPEAKRATTAANLLSLRSAVVFYAGKTGGLPPNLDSLVSKGFMRKLPREMMNNTDRVIVDPSGNPDFAGGWCQGRFKTDHFGRSKIDPPYSGRSGY